MMVFQRAIVHKTDSPYLKPQICILQEKTGLGAVPSELSTIEEVMVGYELSAFSPGILLCLFVF